jgi:competence ComEA-like helix-hairpin-helix protein
MVDPALERVERLRALRLTDGEAWAARALALVAVLTLAPSAWRLLPVAAPPPPLPSCAEVAVRALDGAIGCAVGPGAEPLVGVPALLMGVKLDVNRAPVEALEIVPGIGPKLAARIVEDRRERGAFASVLDVERVRGIGPKLAARLQRFATARP